MNSNLLDSNNLTLLQADNILPFQEGEGEPNTVKVLAAYETTTRRRGFFGDFDLILRVNEDAVDLNRFYQGVMPFTADHDRTAFIGAFEAAEVTDGSLVMEARMSRNAKAKEVFQDIQDGLRKAVSIEFNPTEVNDLTKKGDDIPTLEVAKWELVGVSSVAAPQLAGAQVQYSQEAFDTYFAPLLKKEATMEPETQVIQEVPDYKEAILKLGQEYQDEAGAVAFALTGKSDKEYLADLLTRRSQAETPPPTPAPPTAELRAESLYDFGKALAFAMSNPADITDSLKEHCGLEVQASQKILGQHDRLALPGRRPDGLMIPWEALLKSGQVDFTVVAQQGVAGQPQDIAEYIPLRVRETVMPFQEMATIMPYAQVYAGLVGEEQVPVIYRRSGDAIGASSTNPSPSPKEVDDGTAIVTTEDPNFAGPKFSPKVLQIGTQFSNLAIFQSSGRVESDVLRFIMSELNYEFDEKVLKGSAPGTARRISGLLEQASGTDLNEREVYKPSLTRTPAPRYRTGLRCPGLKPCR